MKAGVIAKQIQAADLLARVVDGWLAGVGSVDECRRALKDYWAAKPLPPELPDSVEWTA